VKVSRVPFLIVFLSSLMPVAGSLLDTSMYHVPVGLTVVALFISVTRPQNNINFVFHKKLPWVILVIFSVLTIAWLTGRGFVILGAGGYVLICVSVYYHFFRTESGMSVKTIVWWVSLLYKFFMTGMLIELFIIMAGHEAFLGQLFHSEAASGYKMYNHAYILRLLGLSPDEGGLNSILLGSQIAGMLSLFSTIWFLGIRHFCSKGVQVNRNKFWIILSIGMLLVSMTGTVLVLILLAFIVYYFLIKAKHLILYLIVMGLCSIGVYLLISHNILFGRIFTQENILYAPGVQLLSSHGVTESEMGYYSMLDYYTFAFFNPVYIWLSLDWVNQAIGVGAQYMLNSQTYIGGDFGFATDVLLKTGIVWAVVFVTSVLVICLPVLKNVVWGNGDQRVWSGLAATFALISLLFLFSTFHYDQALGNPGGVALFALHLALTMYCQGRSKTLLYCGLTIPTE